MISLFTDEPQKSRKKASQKASKSRSNNQGGLLAALAEKPNDNTDVVAYSLTQTGGLLEHESYSMSSRRHHRKVASPVPAQSSTHTGRPTIKPSSRKAAAASTLLAGGFAGDSSLLMNVTNHQRVVKSTDTKSDVEESNDVLSSLNRLSIQDSNHPGARRKGMGSSTLMQITDSLEYSDSLTRFRNAASRTKGRQAVSSEPTLHGGLGDFVPETKNRSKTSRSVYGTKESVREVTSSKQATQRKQLKQSASLALGLGDVVGENAKPVSKPAKHQPTQSAESTFGGLMDFVHNETRHERASQESAHRAGMNFLDSNRRKKSDSVQTGGLLDFCAVDEENQSTMLLKKPELKLESLYSSDPMELSSNSFTRSGQKTIVETENLSDRPSLANELLDGMSFVQGDPVEQPNEQAQNLTVNAVNNQINEESTEDGSSGMVRCTAMLEDTPRNPLQRKSLSSCFEDVKSSRDFEESSEGNALRKSPMKDPMSNISSTGALDGTPHKAHKQSSPVSRKRMVGIASPSFPVSHRSTTSKYSLSPLIVQAVKRRDQKITPIRAVENKNMNNRNEPSGIKAHPSVSIQTNNREDPPECINAHLICHCEGTPVKLPQPPGRHVEDSCVDEFWSPKDVVDLYQNSPTRNELDESMLSVDNSMDCQVVDSGLMKSRESGEPVFIAQQACFGQPKNMAKTKSYLPPRPKSQSSAGSSGVAKSKIPFVSSAALDDTDSQFGDADDDDTENISASGDDENIFTASSKPVVDKNVEPTLCHLPLMSHSSRASFQRSPVRVRGTSKQGQSGPPSQYSILGEAYSKDSRHKCIPYKKQDFGNAMNSTGPPAIDSSVENTQRSSSNKSTGAHSPTKLSPIQSEISGQLVSNILENVSDQPIKNETVEPVLEATSVEQSLQDDEMPEEIHVSHKLLNETHTSSISISISEIGISNSIDDTLLQSDILMAKSQCNHDGVVKLGLTHSIQSIESQRRSICNATEDTECDESSCIPREDTGFGGSRNIESENIANSSREMSKETLGSEASVPRRATRRNRTKPALFGQFASEQEIERRLKKKKRKSPKHAPPPGESTEIEENPQTIDKESTGNSSKRNADKTTAALKSNLKERNDDKCLTADKAKVNPKKGLPSRMSSRQRSQPVKFATMVDSVCLEGVLKSKAKDVDVLKSKPKDAQMEDASDAITKLAEKTSDKWTDFELDALKNAHRTVSPTSSSFWYQVANRVPGRSEVECRAKWFALFKTPTVKAKKATLSKPGDDFFDATPFRQSAEPEVGSSLRRLDLGSAIKFDADETCGSMVARMSISSENEDEYHESEMYVPRATKSHVQQIKRQMGKAMEAKRKKDRRNRNKQPATNIPRLPKLFHSQDDSDMKARFSLGGTVQVEMPETIDEDDFFDEYYGDE